MGNCTEDDGLGLESLNWDWNFGFGIGAGKPGSGRPGNGKPGNSRPDKPDIGSPGDGNINWDDIMDEIEKTLTSECPMIEADQNEAVTGPICNDYFCARDCNEGFIPSHPMKVSLSSGNSINDNFRSSVKKMMMQIFGPHLKGKQNWVHARKIMDRGLGTGTPFRTGNLAGIW